MEPSQTDDIMDHKRCLELAQFYHAVKKKQHSFVQKFIEKNPNNINTRIPNNSFFRSFMPDLIGGTLLHVAYTENDVNTYRFLLSKGADFTLKNRQASTVVHRIVENSYDEYSKDTLRSRFKNPFLAATLFAHCEYRVHQNPSNRHGITHLHAACMANSADTVAKLLTHGALVDQAVNMNSPYFPGYTPLHFAVAYSEMCTIETIKLLMKHGADVNVEDKYGLTPLDVLLKRHVSITQLMETEMERSAKNLLKALLANESLIKFFIENSKVRDLSRFQMH